MNKEHIGSDFDDFLREEGLLEDAEATAAKQVVAFRVAHCTEEAELLAQQEEQEWREEAAKARKGGSESGG